MGSADIEEIVESDDSFPEVEILKPEQKQTIEAFLPQLTDPESYLSEVRLL